MVSRHFVRLHLVPLIVLLPMVMRAQTIGRLVGTVTDDSERPLQGAVVKVMGASPARELVINKADGSYALNGMRPGDYEIEFRAKGFDAQRKSVRIAADRTSILNARLTLEQPESVVGVPSSIGERPPTKSTGSVANIGTSGSDAPPPSPAAEPAKSTVTTVELPAMGSTNTGDTTSARGLGGILVNVIDDDGKPLAGARLLLGDTKKSIPALSDGSIGVERVPPGDYEITLNARGFQMEKRTVRVVAGRVITLIVKLAGER